MLVLLPFKSPGSILVLFTVAVIKYPSQGNWETNGLASLEIQVTAHGADIKAEKTGSSLSYPVCSQEQRVMN